jgi:hypothetical protein
MTRRAPDWERYERLVARLMAEQLPTEYCVTPNARVLGRITQRKRQLDVLIDPRHDSDSSRRLIVDAKRRNRKIDVTDVEAFRGLMEDVGATHGYLVCPHGHTKAAERRAQAAVTIRLLPLDRLDEFDPSTWPQCQNSPCKNGRVFWDGYPEIRLTLRPLKSTADGALKQIPFVHYVGKCDRCGRFHVKCLTCGEILSVPEDDADDCGHQCVCRPPWFWLASVENDGKGNRSAELHAIFGLGEVRTVDRRSL